MGVDEEFQAGREDRGDGNPWKGAGGRNPDVDFRGQARRNYTHRSTTDPEAMLARKGRGQPSVLGYHMHALMDNRNGLVTDVDLTLVTGRAELDAGAELLRRQQSRVGRTVAGDKGYDNRGFIGSCRDMGVTPDTSRRT